MNKPLYIIGDPKFSNPLKGIAPHPLEGLGHVRNVDVLTNPGSIRLNNLTSKQSSTTVTGQINWQRTNPLDSKVYAVDDAGKVYTALATGGTWTVIAGNSGGAGRGLEIWKDYVIVDGTLGQLDAYGPLSGSPSWHNDFTATKLDVSTQSELYCPMLRSMDDKLYIGNARYVSSLAEVSTFDPTSSATFTWTQKAITLAVNYQVTTLRDLGSNLMIGTAYYSAPSFSNTLADIFPYSRASIPVLGLPIRIVEKGIRAMYNLGNRLYVLAGTSGKLFLTDTVSATQIAQIPNYIINLDATSVLQMFPDAIMYLKGKIWFGIGTSSLGNAGVWSYNTITKALQMEQIISTGNDGSSAACYISSLQPLSQNSALIAWRDGASTYGVDLIDNTNRYTGYVGYIDSPLVKIGDALEQGTKPQLEINLIKPLVTGQGVKIQYRLNLTSSFTDLGTFDFATYGGYISLNVPSAVLTNAVFLQIRVLLTAGSGNLSPELQSVMLKGKS